MALYLCSNTFQVKSLFSPSKEEIQVAADEVEDLVRNGKTGGLVTWRMDDTDENLQYLEVWERQDLG